MKKQEKLKANKVVPECDHLWMFYTVPMHVRTTGWGGSEIPAHDVYIEKARCQKCCIPKDLSNLNH